MNEFPPEVDGVLDKYYTSDTLRKMPKPQSTETVQEDTEEESEETAEEEESEGDV